MKNFSKRIISAILTVSMLFTLSATAMAEDSGGEIVSYTNINGEEFYIKDEGITSIAPEIIVDSTAESGSSPFNYHPDWKPAPSVSSSPYNGIVKVIPHFPKGTAVAGTSGTGFVCADGRILTAAHNLYNNKLGVWIDSITIEFRRNGNSVYKTITTNDGTVPSAWLNAFGTDDAYIYDYAILRVPTSYTSGATKFGLYAGLYYGTQYTISGYPNKYPFNSRVMYTDTGYIESDFGYTAKHDIDIMSGVSGGPMYGSNNYAVGIQTRGHSNLVDPSADADDEYGTGGWITPITSSVISFAKYA